ncbi:MAG: DUF4838 domain-containing protein [Candidatus Omnitrophica bacterium]|nr:DUF4838 domain-containing protein [Candidatus Omnitrophota bacterium]
MLITYSNLDDDRKIFLNKELADTLYLCRKRKIPIPEVDVNVISLSLPSQIPPQIREKIKIKEAKKEKEFTSFSQLCDWEKTAQTSQIIQDEDKIWIIGGSSEGSISGFYEAIKNITGIRWYGTSESDVFFAQKSENLEKIHTPVVALRGFEFSPKNENNDFAKKFLKWMVRNGWNLLDINASRWENFSDKREFLKLCEMLGIRTAIGCHAIDFFVPETLFSQNPEFFGLRDGKRVVQAEISSPDIRRRRIAKIQPCYSNPELRKFLVNAIKHFIETHPETYIFSLWPLDGINNWCQCDDCKRLTSYETLYNLALEISQAIGKFLPVELLCYSNMFHLPEKDLVPSSNTYTIFCPYLRNYKHRFYDPGFEETKLTLGTDYPEPEPINPVDDREYGILLSKWLPYLARIGSQLGIFSYYQLVFHDETEKTDRQRYLYHPDPKLVEDEIKKFIDLGINVFYDCSPPYPGFWPDGRYYAYVSRLFWKDSPPVEKVVMEYYKAIAGERASVLQNILKAISDDLTYDRKISEDLLKTAESIFGFLPSPLDKRYRFWLEYVKMGKHSWNALKNGNIKTVIEKEKQIIDFFERNRYILEDCVSVDWMIRLSQSIINFYT